MRRRSVFLAAVGSLVLLLGASACGGGGSNDAAATTETTVTEVTTTEEVVTVSTTIETSVDLDFEEVVSDEDCRELAELSTKLSSAFGGAAGAGANDYAAFLSELADRVPDEIRADFRVIADAFAKIADALGDLEPGSTPDPATIAKLQQLSGELDQAKLTKASTNISAWIQKNCVNTP